MASSLFEGIEASAVAPEGSSIMDRAVMLSVTFKAWGRSRQLRANQYDVDMAADEKIKRTRAGKKLLEKVPEVMAIAQHYSELRKWLAARCLPSSFRAGVYLWPVASIAECMAHIDAQQAALGPLVDALAAVWDSRVSEDIAALGGVGDARDYPTVEEMRAQFAISYLVFEAAAPGSLARVNLAAYEQAREQAAEMWRSAAEEGVKALAGEVDDLCSHLVERLTPGPDGKPKIMRDSTVVALDEWAALYHQRGAVLQSTELDAAVNRLRGVMRGVDPAVLRGSDTARAHVAAQLAGVREQLGSLVIDKPARKLLLVDVEDDI
jgi:hypothetical protein